MGCIALKHCFSLHTDTTPPQPNHNVTPTHIEPEQYNPWNNSTNKPQAPEDGCINIRNMLSIKLWNNKASGIKLFSLYSTIKMMHGPINIRFTKCVFWFSTIFVGNISHSKKKWERYNKNFTVVFRCSAFYFSPILMKLVHPWQSFEKYSNVQFYKNPSSESRVFPCGQTDGQMRRS